jgi:acyl-CoA synthetase (AMP-forming)/AMP-acid ligase II
MLTIGQIADHNERNWAEHTAYVDGGRRRTWREIGQRTDALGHALRARGLGPGDRVAILAPDRVEQAELFIACAKVGAVRVGFNYRLAAAELAQLLDDSDPALVFVDPAESGLLAEALAGAAASPDVIALDDEYEGLVAEHAAATRLEQTFHELVMICYTTGSTGLPKGALYTHEAVLSSMMRIALCEGASHDDVWLHTMPAGGVPLLHLCRNLFHGSTTVIAGRWDPERALDFIEREGVTISVLVPTMLVGLLEAARGRGGRPGASLRQLEYGAAPLPPAVIREAMAVFGCPFLQMYGTTELTGMASMLFPSDHARGLTTDPEILASAGRPLPYTEVRVVDDDGQDVPRGDTGELIVRSDLVIPGYWRAPEKFGEAVRDGWLYTGDIVRQDERGYLYMGDRKSFRIKSGGYNIFPVEVENALAEHPAVREVSVVGVPDPRWGERVHAVVALREGAAVDAQDLRTFCGTRIGTFKVPKTIEFWDALPRGATGKVLKREIRDRCSQPAA